ncbi:MAG: hypothetical protein WBA91_09550, partial [Paracoccaceae bacterium]
LMAADCAAEADRCKMLERIELRNREENLLDIARNRPDMLIIDKDHYWIKQPDFSWYDYLGKDARWEGILADFRLARSTERFDIWVRAEAAPDVAQ